MGVHTYLRNMQVELHMHIEYSSSERFGSLTIIEVWSRARTRYLPRSFRDFSSEISKRIILRRRGKKNKKDKTCVRAHLIRVRVESANISAQCKVARRITNVSDLVETMRIGENFVAIIKWRNGDGNARRRGLAKKMGEEVEVEMEMGEGRKMQLSTSSSKRDVELGRSQIAFAIKEKWVNVVCWDYVHAWDTRASVIALTSCSLRPTITGNNGVIRARPNGIYNKIYVYVRGYLRVLLFFPPSVASLRHDEQSELGAASFNYARSMHKECLFSP